MANSDLIKGTGVAGPIPATMTTVLRAGRGPVNVEDYDTRATPLFPGEGKAGAGKELAKIAPQLDEFQERLHAQGIENPDTAPRVLLILQGMDTSGKGGVIRHVIGQVDPQGVAITGFKAPTKEEREHDFLWRIERAVPGRGKIGIFDRSQYEDVLIQRVEKMAPAKEIERRYDAINEFEHNLTEQGVRIIKCFLNISRDEQQERLLERLGDPRKYWKYNPGDVDARARWGDYMDAYGIALERCNEDFAPWYVIPADRKWYRNWAISALLAEVLGSLDLTWPPADFDIDVERGRVRNS